MLLLSSLNQHPFEYIYCYLVQITKPKKWYSYLVWGLVMQSTNSQDRSSCQVLTSLLIGILVTADESIMAIIKKINEQNGHRYILEDLGDKNCLIKEGTLEALEAQVKAVGLSFLSQWLPATGQFSADDVIDNQRESP